MKIRRWLSPESLLLPFATLEDFHAFCEDLANPGKRVPRKAVHGGKRRLTIDSPLLCPESYAPAESSLSMPHAIYIVKVGRSKRGPCQNIASRPGPGASIVAEKPSCPGPSSPVKIADSALPNTSERIASSIQCKTGAEFRIARAVSLATEPDLGCKLMSEVLKLLPSAVATETVAVQNPN